jgi:hypothetical protein
LKLEYDKPLSNFALKLKYDKQLVTLALKLKYDRPFPNFASNLNLRHYNKANTSYGGATLEESMATIGISAEDLKKYCERFTDAGDESKYLIGWKPRFAGPLSTLAPEAVVMLLARSAAEPVTSVSA